MRVTRLYTGTDGQSHFEDTQITLSKAEIGTISEPLHANCVLFGEIDDDAQEVSWHNPPAAQYVIMLEGSMEIEVGNGNKRIFYPGDILLAEDIKGEGHIKRAAHNGKRRYLVIPKA